MRLQWSRDDTARYPNDASDRVAGSERDLRFSDSCVSYANAEKVL
jgi:hypothetical protein